MNFKGTYFNLPSKNTSFDALSFNLGVPQVSLIRNNVLKEEPKLKIKNYLLPDNVSCIQMLHSRVDDGHQRYVGHIAYIIIDQELEVGYVD